MANKAAAISLVANYREAYGLFACSGLLFNHESPLRPSRFVTRRVTAAAARIGAGSRERLTLDNLSICRDWGWQPAYVDAMWRMLQCDQPDDFHYCFGRPFSMSTLRPPSSSSMASRAGATQPSSADRDPH